MAASSRDQERIVGTLLGDAREAAGLTQPAAARHLGISQSRLAQLELGNRRLLLTEAFMVAELYGITLTDLDPRGRTAPPEPRQRRTRVDRRRRSPPVSDSALPTP